MGKGQYLISDDGINFTLFEPEARPQIAFKSREMFTRVRNKGGYTPLYFTKFDVERGSTLEGGCVVCPGAIDAQ